MPYDIQLKDDDQLMLACIWGILDNDLFSNYIMATETYVPLSGNYRLLVIFDEETKLQMDTQLIRDLARRPPVFGPGAMRVIVASENLAFALSRVFMMEAATASDQYNVVRTLDEAAEMLAIDVSTIVLPKRQV